MEPNVCTCKPGASKQFSTSKKNVLVIGDSISIGWTPWAAKNLSDVALVQHSPWDVRDGGAEEAAYGKQCLEFFLSSPGGRALTPDLVVFNWGMHDGPMSNATVPGQNGPSSQYPVDLADIARRLAIWAATGERAERETKLLFVLTTPFVCSINATGNVLALNNVAREIMDDANIPVFDPFPAIVDRCSPLPNPTCDGIDDCWCPHCPAQWGWLAEMIVPTMRTMLLA